MKVFGNFAIAPLLLASSTRAFANQDSSSPLVSMGASLLAVIAIIVALAFVAKRIGIAGSAGNSRIKVISQLAIGPREKVCIIEVGEEWLVVGTTAQQMTLLSKTTRIETAGNLPPESTRPDFSKLLDTLRGRIGK